MSNPERSPTLKRRFRYTHPQRRLAWNRSVTFPPRKSWRPTTSEQKHHYHRFAASRDYLDWATQPNPFRRYEGAPLIRLPFPESGRALQYWQLYVTGSVVPAPLSIDSVSLLLHYAPLADRLEMCRRNDMVTSRQPFERKPAPDGGMFLCLPWLPSTMVPASTTTHRRNTVWSAGQILIRRSGLPSWPGFRTAHLPWGSRPFFGEKPGNMGSARSAIANTTLAMPLGRYAWRLCAGLETLPPRPCRPCVYVAAPRARP